MFQEHKLSFGTVPSHLLRTSAGTLGRVRFAVSPNERLLRELVGTLDDGLQPAAETWRRVGAAAEQAGLLRPSYGHVRRLVCAERALRRVRARRREVLADAAARLAAGAVPNVPRLIETLTALHEEELVFLEHKAL